MQCKNKPCVNGCPVNVPIPDFIKAISEGEFEKAYQIIIKENSLPAICGRVCPQESQCEGKCVRGKKGEPVEAYVSTAATSFTDPLAMEAIKLVYKQIPVAYAEGENMKAREDMHNASALAGMSFSNASLGLVHSLAHKIGGELGITHGLANAILLPYIVEYSMKVTDEFAEIEKQLEIDDLVEELKSLNKKVGIPTSLKEITEVEIIEEKFIEILDRMSKNTFEDPCTLTNPRVTSPEDVNEIYKSAFYGKTAKNI